jgi:SAM domain (Sterile alpha motif)
VVYPFSILSDFKVRFHYRLKPQTPSFMASTTVTSSTADVKTPLPKPGGGGTSLSGNSTAVASVPTATSPVSSSSVNNDTEADIKKTRDFLDSKGFGYYFEVLAKAGYERRSALQLATTEDLEKLGFKTGHAKLIISELQQSSRCCRNHHLSHLIFFVVSMRASENVLQRQISANVFEVHEQDAPLFKFTILNDIYNGSLQQPRVVDEATLLLDTGCMFPLYLPPQTCLDLQLQFDTVGKAKSATSPFDVVLFKPVKVKVQLGSGMRETYLVPACAKEAYDLALSASSGGGSSTQTILATPKPLTATASPTPSAAAAVSPQRSPSPTSSRSAVGTPSSSVFSPLPVAGTNTHVPVKAVKHGDDGTQIKKYTELRSSLLLLLWSSLMSSGNAILGYPGMRALGLCLDAQQSAIFLLTEVVFHF